MNEIAEKPRRRRWAFSLRTLMIFVLIVGGFLGWKANQAYRQRQAVAIIQAVNGTITYDFQKFPPGTPAATRKAAKPPGPEWLRKWIGDEYFQEVTGVSIRDEATAQVLHAVASLEKLEILRIARPFSDSQDLLPLTALPHLKLVDLCGPAVDDEFLEHVSRSKSIDVIETHETSVTDKGVRFLANRTNIKSLAIYNSPKVTDASVKEVIPRLTSLTSLDLSGTSITDASIEVISAMSQLNYLCIKDIDLTDRGMASLARLTKLTTLFLDRTKITDEGLSQLSELTELRQLDLKGTRIKGFGFSKLGKLEKLLFLHLDGSQFSDEGMPYVARMKWIQILLLHQTQVSDKGLALIQGFPNLRTITTGSSQVTDAGMAAFRAANPKVRQASNKPVPPKSPVGG